jgi:hypothetical protein
MLNRLHSQRRVRLIAVLTMAAFLSAGFATGAERPLHVRLAGLRVMHFHAGVNNVPNFAGDGRTAQIIEGWRDNGNAHSYNLYVVLLPSRPGRADWNVVGVDGSDHFEDTVADAPHTGEDVVRSVVFAKGLLDGRRATLLLTATRKWQESIPDPATTEIQAYVLRQNTEGVGETRDYFEPVGSYLTETKYCHAEKALNAEFGISLSPGYAGGDTRTGCFERH